MGNEWHVPVRPLTAEAFAPYGQVIEPGPGEPETNLTLLQNKQLQFAEGALPDEQEAQDSTFDVLRFWMGRAELVLDQPALAFMRVLHRPFRFHLMERHLKGTQTFFPMGGGTSLFAVAPPSDLGDPDALPDPDRIVAFVLDGSRAVNIRVGTWHWTPFPLSASSDFIIMVRREAPRDDLHFVNLRHRVGVECVLELP